VLNHFLEQEKNVHKILVINPNSSVKMTKDIIATVAPYENSECMIDVVFMEKSPNVLESFSDYLSASKQMQDYIIEKQVNTNYDGVVIACFGDPGLYAIKEMLSIPVIGIAEAAIARSILLGAKYSIICASYKAKSMMENLVDMYGMQGRCGSVKTLHCQIEDFLDDQEKLNQLLIENIRYDKNATDEVFILGCAGMTMADINRIEKECEVAMIDPVKAGLSTMIAILLDKNQISKKGFYK
jgi:allantoin racemase